MKIYTINSLSLKNLIILSLLLLGFVHGIYIATDHLTFIYSPEAIFNGMIPWQTSNLNTVAHSFSSLGGNKVSILAFILLFGILAYYRCWKNIFFVFITASCTISTLLLCKLLINSPRPLQEGIAILNSFPSGHATRASLIFGLLLIFNLKAHVNHKFIYVISIGCCVVPLLVGLSRLLLEEHWFNDVLAAYFLATFYLYLNYHLTYKSIQEAIPLHAINGILGVYYLGLFLGHILLA